MTAKENTTKKSLPQKAAKLLTKGLIVTGKWGFKTALFTAKGLAKGVKEGVKEAKEKA